MQATSWVRTCIRRGEYSSSPHRPPVGAACLSRTSATKRATQASEHSFEPISNPSSSHFLLSLSISLSFVYSHEPSLALCNHRNFNGVTFAIVAAALTADVSVAVTIAVAASPPPAPPASRQSGLGLGLGCSVVHTVTCTLAYARERWNWCAFAFVRRPLAWCVCFS